jgi:4-hydroxybenzoyl-CoA thioesterase
MGVTLKARFKVRVQWADCDMAQVMYYPNYLRMFDSATHHLMEQAGKPIPGMIREYEIIGLPIVDTHAAFKLPCTWGDELEVESFIGEWRRKTFTVNHTIWKDGEAAVEGHEIRMWGLRRPDDPGKMMAGEIPDDFKAVFNGAGSS